ncbi:DUF1643 domain-containing protein [Salipaludibacillus sp. CUR1]|uniref:DUF1643 domain-containing protein n=1 Tax=Salipaludibacillus sp. CUR1 TaxID=2820003 RepID=UPI001E36B032|nr:DUF1643 domain-containing protein [Salipaludibacillus sp. CUR1]MCE7791519.1 DUF1643 domain-containing protein [Salipaludibacillus sp. CUR1]
MAMEIEQQIKMKVVMSDCRRYRYLYTKVWDENKPGATVIMLNPSKADMVKLDKTVLSLTNYFVSSEFGQFKIANMYSFMCTEPKDLKYKNELLEKVNDSFIQRACEGTDFILIGWGSDHNKRKGRKKEVEQLLRNHSHKLKCFIDSQNKSPRHPRDIADDWRLIDYKFRYI